MFCDYCGNFLSDNWKYCPYCGRKIDGAPDILDSLFREGVTGFSIRVTSFGGKGPKVREIPSGPVRVPIEDVNEVQEPRSFRKVVEPEGTTQKIGQHLLITVRLPGVKEEDVDVRKLEESVEIKAYRKGEAFFKQVQVPESARIISRHMEGDELIIEVG